MNDNNPEAWGYDTGTLSTNPSWLQDTLDRNFPSGQQFPNLVRKIIFDPS